MFRTAVFLDVDLENLSCSIKYIQKNQRQDLVNGENNFIYDIYGNDWQPPNWIDLATFVEKYKTARMRKE